MMVTGMPTLYNETVLHPRVIKIVKPAIIDLPLPVIGMGYDSESSYMRSLPRLFSPLRMQTPFATFSCMYPTRNRYW